MPRKPKELTERDILFHQLFWEVNDFRCKGVKTETLKKIIELIDKDNNEYYGER